VISTIANIRSFGDSLDLFLRDTKPFHIAWAKYEHFYPIIAIHCNDHSIDLFVHMNSVDVDKANFLMLMKDMLEFIRSIAHLATRQVKVNNLDQLKEWLHMISI